MRILRLPEVQAKTGLKHSAIYERISHGTFPRPIAIGTRARGFLESEVDDWIKTRVKERDAVVA